MQFFTNFGLSELPPLIKFFLEIFVSIQTPAVFFTDFPVVVYTLGAYAILCLYCYSGGL